MGRIRLELAVLLPLARGRSRLTVADPQAALDLAADVFAVQLLVAGEERAVDVGRLAHEVGAVLRSEREIDGAPSREALRRRRDACTHIRLRVLKPRNSDFEL